MFILCACVMNNSRKGNGPAIGEEEGDRKVAF